jgi:hypothetical protein
MLQFGYNTVEFNISKSYNNVTREQDYPQVVQLVNVKLTKDIASYFPIFYEHG